MTEDKRTRKRKGEFKPTPRQENILLALSRHRLLTTHQIVRIDEGSEQTARRKILDQLLEHGYIQKKDGLPINHPRVFALKNKGKSHLSSKCGVPYHLLAHHNRRPGEQVAHTLLTADIMIAFEQACEKSERFEYISSQDILAKSPDETRRSKTPFSWSISYKFRGVKVENKGIVPDRIFGIRDLWEPKEDEVAESFFCLEADTGSETITTDKLSVYLEKSTTWLGKSLQYRATQSAGLFQKRYDEPFRVLLVTKAEPKTRLLKMMEATRDAYEGHRTTLFLFTTIDKILETSPLELEWLQADGTKKKLVED